jgi:hypothetical protein
VEQIQNPKSKILKPSDLSVGSIQNPKSKIQNRMTNNSSQEAPKIICGVNLKSVLKSFEVPSGTLRERRKPTLKLFAKSKILLEDDSQLN